MVSGRMGRLRKESQATAPAAVLVPELLNECQKSQAGHVRGIRQLVECRRGQMDDFLKVWISCLQPMFLVSKMEPAVENMVHFASSLAAYWDAELSKECEKFFESFLSILLDWSGAVHKTVRFRACQMISATISKLEPHFIVTEDMWDRMTSTMQTRMQDKQSSVRVFAASALSRLVIADDIENDVAVQAYRKALASDRSAEVRKTVVKCMPAANATVHDIVQRIADVSESVRKAAYQTIGERLYASGLSITQRAMTIERGLAERAPGVREECEKLLELWLQKDCDGDPLTLLRYLDVETYEKVGETVMLELLSKNLIKFSDTGLRKFLDTSGNQQLTMSVEEALFWRVVCTHIHSEAKVKASEAANTRGAEATLNAAVAAERNEYLESILPPTVSDCVRLVEAHLHQGSVAWFAARQLLSIAKLMDYTDSTSRKDAGLLLQRLLRETAPAEIPKEQSDADDLSSPEWVGDGLSLGGEESWANAVAEFARHVHASSGEFEEVLAAAVADVGKPCREGGADEGQWLHCLAVTGLLLGNIKSLDVLTGRAIEPEEIIQSLLLPAVKHLHLEVQRAGVRCLGMFCGLERSPSPRGVEELRLHLESGRSQVQKMALKAMFDLVLCHGAAQLDRAASLEPHLGLPTPHPRPPGIHIPDCNGTGAQLGGQIVGRRSRLPLLEVLEECLHGEILMDDSEERKDYINHIVGIAAEGFAKVLLLNKRFPDVRFIQERVVEELLMVYFSDGTTHSRLKQCLAVFFRIWCSLSAANKRCISAVFIPVVRKKWPGIYEQRDKLGTVRFARSHATQAARFMLYLLHLPPTSNANQQRNQTTLNREDDGGAVSNSEGAPLAADCDDAVDEGLETLAARICVEVKSQARKFTSLSIARRTYTLALCRVIALLRFSPVQQKKIKVLLCLIPRLIEWVPDSEKTSSKALGEALERLKKQDELSDIGLTDEELELFMVRMGFHDYFKENNSPDPSTPEIQSVSRTGGRKVSGASRTSVNSRGSVHANSGSLRSRSGSQKVPSRGRKGVASNIARKNLSSVDESFSDESDASTVCSVSDSDFEVE